MAYLHTDNGIACFRIRCMHDNMDFSGAVMENIQYRGAAAGGISFVMDHGDYHYILTPLQDGKMIADELSVDFVVEGAVKDVSLSKEEIGIWCFSIGECILYLKIPEAQFGDSSVKFEQIDTQDKKGIRCILHRGRREVIDFPALKKAFVLYWIEIVLKNEMPVSFAQTKHEGEKVQIFLSDSDGFQGKTEIEKTPGLYMPQVSGLKKVFRNGGFYYHDEELLENIH